jgi:hypothetical protein
VDIAAIESFFSSLKTEPIGRKVYRTADAARADVFDDIARDSTIRSAGIPPSATSAWLSSKGRSD